jgi:hypothetical protein
MFLSWCRTMHFAPARLPLTPGFWNDGNSAMCLCTVGRKQFSGLLPGNAPVLSNVRLVGNTVV